MTDLGKPDDDKVVYWRTRAFREATEHRRTWRLLGQSETRGTG